MRDEPMCVRRRGVIAGERYGKFDAKVKRVGSSKQRARSKRSNCRREPPARNHVFKDVKCRTAYCGMSGE